MRREIYSCRRKPGSPCCAECGEVCSERCLNHPSRCKVCDREGRSTKAFGRPRIHNWDEILQLRREGLSYAAIAERMGCSVSTVVRAVAEMAREGKL